LDDSDSGGDEEDEAEFEVFKEIYATGMYGPEDGFEESRYGPRPVAQQAM